MARLTLWLGGRQFLVDASGGNVTVDGVPVPVTAFEDGSVRIEDGSGQRAWTIASGDVRWVFLDGRVYEFDVERPGVGRKRGGSHHGSLTAPMPATVLRLAVKEGDIVKKGQTVVLLEAMKMELPVRTAAGGKVTAVNCREGELVQPGTILVELAEGD
jgi:3-methylcrotonyl-CoA carboxylase alpha subunit